MPPQLDAGQATSPRDWGESGFRCYRLPESGPDCSPGAGLAGAELRLRACSLRRRRFSRKASARRSVLAARSRLFPFSDIVFLRPSLVGGTSLASPPYGAQAGAQILAVMSPLWHLVRARLGGFRPAASNRCRSSVVEHFIGNEEVDSSILSGSTISSAI